MQPSISPCSRSRKFAKPSVIGSDTKPAAASAPGNGPQIARPVRSRKNAVSVTIATAGSRSAQLWTPKIFSARAASQNSPIG